MNERKFYELMGEIDPEIIAAADKPVPFRKKRGFRIALIAAVLALAVLLVPVGGAFALIVGYHTLAPDVNSPDGDNVIGEDGKPAGLVGELFGGINWGALGDAVGKDGNVNWKNFFAVLQGKDPDPSVGTVAFEAVKLDDGTMKITGVTTLGTTTEITVPETISGSRVTVIGEWAFAENANLTHVTLPDTVTVIENSAFHSCTNLETVEYSDNLVEIGEYAFAACNALTNCDLPETLQALGDYAFLNCSSIKSVTIPSSLQNWGTHTFYVTGLQTLEIEEGVPYIPAESFRGTKIEQVWIPSSVKEIGDCAFNRCQNLSNVMLNDGLERIGADVFDGTAISEFTVPATVTEIYDVYFSDCNNLEKVIFMGDAPNIQSTHRWYANSKYESENLIYQVYYTLGAQGFSSSWHVFQTQLLPMVTQPFVTECGLETVPFYAEILLGTSGTSYFEGDAVVLNDFKQYQAFSKKMAGLIDAGMEFDRTYFESFSIVLIKVTHASSEDIIGVSGLALDQRDPSGDVLLPVITVDSPVGNDADILYTYFAVAIATPGSAYASSEVFIHNLNPEKENGDSVFHDHFPDAFTTPD